MKNLSNEVDNLVCYSVRSSMRNSVWRSVDHSVYDLVWYSIEDSVRDSVRDSVWTLVADSVKTPIWDSVGDLVRKRREMSLHKWTERDDLVAYVCYIKRFDRERILKVAREYKLPGDSLVMRVSNVKSLVEGEGLKNASKQTERVVNLFESV